MEHPTSREPPHTCLCLPHLADASKAKAIEKRKVARAAHAALKEAAKIAHLKSKSEALSLKRKRIATENGAEYAAAATAKKHPAGDEHLGRDESQAGNIL